MSTVIIGKIIWQRVFEALQRSTHAFKKSIKDETRTKWASTHCLLVLLWPWDKEWDLVRHQEHNVIGCFPPLLRVLESSLFISHTSRKRRPTIYVTAPSTSFLVFFIRPISYKKDKKKAFQLHSFSALYSVKGSLATSWKRKLTCSDMTKISKKNVSLKHFSKLEGFKVDYSWQFKPTRGTIRMNSS